MEADWSVEIGSDLPRIVVPWSGPPSGPTSLGEALRYIPLSATLGHPAPASISGIPESEIPEARQHPALARALTALNAADSPVFTSKCDVWELAAEDIDSFEFDADGPANIGFACYIDLVFRDAAQFASFDFHEQWMRRLTLHLQGTAQRSARVEMVLREAEIFAAEGFAVTCYAMGCGTGPPAAQTAWGSALDAMVRAVRLPRLLDSP